MPRAGCTFPRCECIAECGGPVVLERYEPGSWLDRYDKTPCPYCRKQMLVLVRRLAPTRDHVHPKSRGGSDGPENILVVCSKCNNDKGNLTLAEFAGTLEWRCDPRERYVRQVIEARRLVSLSVALRTATEAAE